MTVPSITLRHAILAVVLPAALAGAAALADPDAMSPTAAAQPAPTATPAPPLIPPFPTPSATPQDRSTDEALGILRRSDEAMNALRSASSRWEARAQNGAAGEPFAESELRYVAPDRMSRVTRYRDLPVYRTVRIGRDRWTRSDEDPWEHARMDASYAWPRFWRYQREPTDWRSAIQSVVVERQEALDDRPAWVLSYEQRVMSEEGPYDVFTTEWIEIETHRLLRSESTDTDPWGSRALSVTEFADFDAPITIEPPALVPPPPPAPSQRLLLPLLSRAP